LGKREQGGRDLAPQTCAAQFVQAIEAHAALPAFEFVLKEANL
jgi:hypothetical protein